MDAPIVRTFLIADVRGYTRFTVEHGDEAAARLATRFAEIAERVATAHEGAVSELRGDEALCVFTSARGALRAAIAMQAAFRQALESDPSLALNVGMGLDAGEAIPVKGGYRGAALNLAARLCSIAGPGEIFCSEGVIHLARKLDGIVFADRGPVTLKGFPGEVRVIQIAPEGELPELLPPLRPVLVAHPTNLPDDPTPFIGREREIALVTSLLRDPEIRMVTLTGPGGTGKTRLCLQVGTALLPDFADGVYFVALAPLDDPYRVPAAIADVVGVRDMAAGPPLDSLIAHLGEKRLLLVLDNFEHLTDAASHVSVLLDACRSLSVLVTSRTSLHLVRENEFPVPPLALPDLEHLPDPAAMSQYEAVALFIQRARMVKPDFSVTSENAPAVAEICARLDGLPLAIELAAARVKLFPPQGLLQRLSNRLQLLTGGALDLPSRQQTLRGAIDWSYSLLSPEEQTLFARLSVFHSGCTFEAAEAVCNAQGDLDIFDGLASLVDKSLLRSEEEDEPRFSMLETIHEYAADRLRGTEEEDSLREGHAAYFLGLAEEAAPFLRYTQGMPLLRRLGKERAEIRAALTTFLHAGRTEEAARLAGSVWLVWRYLSAFREGREMMEAALAASGLPPRLRYNLLDGLRFFCWHLGDTGRVRAADRESLELARDLGDPAAETRCLFSIGWDAVDEEKEEGRELIERAIALAPSTGDVQCMATALRSQGLLAADDGDFESAVRFMREEIEFLLATSYTWDLPAAYLNLGQVERKRGNLDAAAAAYRQSIEVISHRKAGLVHAPVASVGLAEVALDQGDLKACLHQLWLILPIFDAEGTLPWVAEMVVIAAGAAAHSGSYILAASLLGAADAIFAAVERRHELDARDRQRFDAARAVLGDAAWNSAYDRRRALSEKEAVELALSLAEEHGVTSDLAGVS